MAYALVSLTIFSVISTLILTLILTSISVSIIRSRKNRQKSLGFFHPYTNDGGGGERVLWCAVKALQEDYPHLPIAIFTGDHDSSPDSLAARALHRFGLRLLRPPQVVHLYRRKWIEDTTYPRFTMIGQSLGSVYLTWEALCKFTPSYYVDTSGYAFTYPIARLFGCKVICYTHYPTISLDMLSRVRGRNSMYNNDSVISQSLWLSRCKVIYYNFFSWMYGIVGSCAHLAMVNSSWTCAHIEKIWGIPDRIKRVYPPCDTSGLQTGERNLLAFVHSLPTSLCRGVGAWEHQACSSKNDESSCGSEDWERERPLSTKDLILPLERPLNTPTIISVAQFRPEKAHPLQLEAFAVVIRKLDADMPKPKLQFVGSCRNKADEERFQNLRNLAVELNVDEDVEFHKNLMYSDLVRLLGNAVAGIHSMTDEHFGISVVEYMAAGAIPIAHNSAGPKMDIVVDEDGRQTGFLAQNVDEYADAILTILKMPESERLEMASAARRRASRFSEQRFYEDFKAAVRPVLCNSFQ